MLWINTKRNGIKIMSKKSNKKKDGLFRAPITAKKMLIYILFALLLTALILLGRFIYRTVINPVSAFDNKPGNTLVVETNTPEPTENSSVETTQTPEPTVTLSPRELLEMEADKDFMKDRVNVLLTGIDYSEEREGRSDFRTDTIMLLSINFETCKVDMISVPRDSYADIAFTDAKWKINGAYMSAGGREGNGFECMMQTVSDCLGGVPIDYYLAVEMQAVKDIVDIIGGVWYDVDYEFTMNGRHLEKGYQHLTGQQVLDYLRLRKGVTGSSDINRIDRQQRLLLEVFNQMKDSALIAKIPEMYKTLQSQIMTNLNFEQIVALSLFALDFDLENGFNRYTLQGEYMAAYNASKYYVLNHEYTEHIVNEIFGITPKINWEYSLEYVKFDMARINLAAAIEDVKQLLIDNQYILAQVYTLAELEAGQDPLEYFAFGTVAEGYAFIEDTLNEAEFELQVEETDAMNEATKALEELTDQLKALILAPPTPTPNPEALPSPEVSTSPSA